MVLYAEIDEGLEKQFRKKVIDLYGASKGALKRAIEEAIEKWLKEK